MPELDVVLDELATALDTAAQDTRAAIAAHLQGGRLDALRQVSVLSTALLEVLDTAIRVGAAVGISIDPIHGPAPDDDALASARRPRLVDAAAQDPDGPGVRWTDVVDAVSAWDPAPSRATRLPVVVSVGNGYGSARSFRRPHRVEVRVPGTGRPELALYLDDEVLS